MNILVTGATGFLGGVVARRLAAAGHRVTGLGRDAARGQVLGADGVRFVPADLHDQAAWQAVLDQQDAVLHAAARSTLWGRWPDFVADNVTVSAALARASTRQGLRLVHISTPSVYNATGQHVQVSESTPIGPRFDSLYARSKYLAEQEVQSLCPDAAILRPRGIYGRGDTSILPRLARALRTGRLPRLTRHEVYTELTHVQNVAHACQLALEGKAAGLFNVTDGVSIPIWATLDTLADGLGAPRPQRYIPAAVVEGAARVLEGLAALHPAHPEPPMTASGVRLLTRPMSLDLSRAREHLGYSPLIHPTQGLAEALEAAQEAQQ